jgi:serine protease
MKFILSLITSLLAKPIILTSKEGTNNLVSLLNLNLNLETFELIGSFGGIVFYKTDTQKHDYTTLNFLGELFDIEYEQVYKINPIVSENVNVVYVPESSNFGFGFEEFETIPWNLDRISKRNLPLNNSYPYSESGSCHKNKNVTINTYIVDTGIDETHPEFQGRAKFLENFSGDGIPTDKNNHGTHCSGSIGSKTYGVCKDANLFGVKVLDGNGAGTTSGVLAGMNYVFNRHLKENSNVRSIMSMSLGGGYSSAMNKAVENMITNSNTFYIVVASGNENSDACDTSPASAKGVLTINAMDKYDNRADFSNYGLCTDIYSTGVDIQSTIPGGKTAVYSGTSMAVPNLVGVLNHYLDMYPDLNMKGIKEKISSDATKDTIKGNPDKTNNLMVYLKR